MKNSLVRVPRTLSVMPTWQCTAACENCGTLSTPHEKARLPLDHMLAAITEAADQGFANVVFTGGEPTLRWNDLKACIAHAKAVGLVTRIVSNAWWAKTDEAARDHLEQLRYVGLDEVNFSTGDEHARFVPLERISHAVAASIRLGFSPHVMIELRATRSVDKHVLLAHPSIATLSITQKACLSISESPWMALDPLELAQYPPGLTVDSANLEECTGCDSVLQTYVLQANGSIGSCCGLGMREISELQAGHYEPHTDALASAVQKAESDIFKLWLRYEGPERILSWAAEIDPSIEWEGMYAHRCQACVRAYRDPAVANAVFANFRSKIPELFATATLQEVLLPTLAPADGEPSSEIARYARAGGWN